MKKNTMKRFLSIFLSVVVIAGFSVPANYAFAADDVEENTAEDILNQDEEAPEGFETSTDPYGIWGTDDVENVLSVNELCISWNTKEDNGTVTYQKFNDLNLSNIGKSSTSSPYFNGVMFEGWSDDENINNYQETETGSYGQNTQCTAYDSDGDGVRESIATVGWDANSIWLYTYNSITEKTATAYAGYAHQTALEDNGEEWRAQGFLDITAGDYDGDGAESIVIAVPRFNGKSYPSIQEWKVNSSYELENVFQDNANWVNQAYVNGEIAEGDYDYGNLLSMQLATGDFNADGIDDLACLSYINDMDSEFDDDNSIDLYVPWLATGLGVEGSGLKSSPDKMVSVNNGQDYPAQAGIACGDVNADEVDEIIIAGYKSYVSNNDGEYEHDYDHIDKDKQILAAYTYDKGVTSRINWQELSSNEWSAGHDWFGGSDDAFPVVGVSTASLDGIGGAESVFIDGTIYSYKLKSGSGSTQFKYEFQKAYTPEYFESVDKAVGGWTVSATYIQDIVAGSFDEDTPGQEQFIGLVAAKKSSSNEYKYIPVIIGKTTNDDGTTEFYCNDVEDTQAWEMTDSRPVAHVSAIDCDNDGITVRMSEKTCVWSDPDVLGVLQAAPYFGELGSYDDFNDGSTTVEFSTSYETGSGTTKSQNIGVGAMFEVEAACVGVAIEAGYSGAWEESVFDTTEEESTVSFTSGALDTVIVKRTPVYCYLYDTLDPTTGKWSDDSYMLTVSQTPQYYQLSLDEYKDFADKYNKQLREGNAAKSADSQMTDEELESAYIWAIDNTADSPLHKEGNPCMYKQGAVSDTTFNLAYAGGSQSVTYAKSTSHEVTKSESGGFTFNTTVYGQVDAGAAKIKAGAYLETEFMWGSETTTTTTNGKATSGTVSNINKASTASALGISQTDVSKYGFQWSFGTWDIYLGAAGTVPVYGYGLGKVKTLHSAVTDVAVYNDGNSFVVTWDDDEAVASAKSSSLCTVTEKSLPIKGYDVYMQKDGGSLEKLNDEPVTSTEFDIPEGTVTAGDRVKFEVIKIAGTKKDGASVAGAVPTVTDTVELQNHESISDQNISIEEGTFTYSGKEIKPEVTVEGLTEGEDYKLTYADNVEPGTATVTVSGLRNYSGTKVLNFTIDTLDIANADAEINGTYTYSGKAKKPTVTIDGLTEGKDFEVTGYADNVNAGTGTVTIAGKGFCTGTKEVKFTIKPYDISKKTVKATNTSKTYTGKTQYPTVTISGLTKNTDFTVSGATSVGKHKITIKGKGNYSGTVTKYLTIKPKKATISSLTSKTKSLTVKMGTKVSSTGGSYYKVQYRVKGTKTWKTKITSSQTCTIKSLKKGKQYQVRVCAYKTVSGTKYTGSWSTIKTSKAVK